MEVYAHRGLLDESGGGALENTPLALQRAVEAGFSVETDFRYGVGHDILIFHDSTLERFGKYLFLRKVARPGPVNRLILAWDVLRWRIYYSVQRQWPAAR